MYDVIYAFASANIMLHFCYLMQQQKKKLFNEFHKQISFKVDEDFSYILDEFSVTENWFCILS